MLSLALLLALRLSPDSAGEKYIQPQLAVDQQRVALAFGAGTTIYYAASTDGGKTFGSPVVVAKVPVLALGRHRGPRIAFAGNAIVISAVQAHERFKEGNLTTWRSTDQGRTWSPGGRINDVDHSAREGLHAMVSGPGGLLFATWLDLRKTGTRLYGSLSKDGGQTWTPNTPVYESPDGHICECCHPSAYIGADGALYAMWRNWLGGSRDMYVAVSRDQGKTFTAQKLGRGTWPLNACPMDGGGFRVDSKGTVHSVWRRDGKIFEASGGNPETDLGSGKDPSMALTPEGVYAAWSENGAIQLKRPGKPVQVLGAQGAYVQLAASGSAVVAAWEDSNGINVEPVPPSR